MGKRIILKRGKEQAILRYHPWIFSGAIAKVEGNPVEGDVVNVYGYDKEFLATGHYAPGSIAVRLLSFTETEIDKQFYLSQITRALELRNQLGFDGDGDTNVFRLIHGEGDGLPGLIVDFYNGTAVMQCHSAGIYHDRKLIAESLIEGGKGIIKSVYDKSETTVPFMAALNPQNGFLIGKESSKMVKESGYSFEIDWVGGQKTGFFIDQRESRRLLLNYTEGKKVLNMFGYTGGFSVYAMKKAALVHSVDSSSPATEMARSNVQLNFPDDKRHEAFDTDAFSFFRESKERYDVIVLDPPAFAKHNSALEKALQGYKRINIQAFLNIAPGGILFTFSCSQVVTRENFRKSVFAAAANTGRKIRILHQLSQPPDHPVSIYHPEGEYLKGLVLHVE